MRNNIKKIILYNLIIWVSCLGSMTTVHAQFFGFSADTAIAYSAADEPLSGASLGISHPIPIVPNIGAMGFFFERRNKGFAGTTLATKVKVTTGNIFYNIPVPFFTLSLGAGAGTIITKTDIVQDIGRVETVEVTTPVGEGFVRFGLPFIHFFDFHIGYHYVTTEDIDLVKDSKTEVEGIKEKVNLSGGLTTVGILIAL